MASYCLNTTSNNADLLKKPLFVITAGMRRFFATVQEVLTPSPKRPETTSLVFLILCGILTLCFSVSCRTTESPATSNPPSTTSSTPSTEAPTASEDCAEMLPGALLVQGFTPIAGYNDGITITVVGRRVTPKGDYYLAYAATTDARTDQVIRAKNYVQAEDVSCLINGSRVSIYYIVKIFPNI